MKELLYAIFAFLGSAAWDEFKESAPWLTTKVLNRAIKSLPANMRERYSEEWLAVIADSPGKLYPLYNACQFWWIASREGWRREMGLRSFEAVVRAIDIFAALVFFLLFGPVYLVVALCVAVSMGRPVHFWQVRIGRDGKPFRFYKFRSMRRDSEVLLERYLRNNHVARNQWDTYQKLERDPRITPFGSLMRKLSLDELPQFWNVLRGDMSLIGPRPCMARQVPLYGKNWSAYCSVRPGITGLWQVSGRNRLSYAQRVKLDAYYAKNRSLWLNIKILAKTARAVILGEGSR